MFRLATERWAGKINRLIAFGTSTAIWLVGFDVLGDYSLPFLSTAWISPMALAAFLFVGAALVGLTEAWLGSLLVLWVVGVVLFVADMGSPPPDFPYGWLMPVMFSLIYVTLAFIAWVATAGALWRVIEGPKQEISESV